MFYFDIIIYDRDKNDFDMCVESYQLYNIKSREKFSNFNSFGIISTYFYSGKHGSISQMALKFKNHDECLSLGLLSDISKSHFTFEVLDKSTKGKYDFFEYWKNYRLYYLNKIGG